jgi:hypothetical protein
MKMGVNFVTQPIKDMFRDIVEEWEDYWRDTIEFTDFLNDYIEINDNQRTYIVKKRKTEIEAEE